VVSTVSGAYKFRFSIRYETKITGSIAATRSATVAVIVVVASASAAVAAAVDFDDYDC